MERKSVFIQRCVENLVKILVSICPKITAPTLDNASILIVGIEDKTGSGFLPEFQENGVLRLLKERRSRVQVSWKSLMMLCFLGANGAGKHVLQVTLSSCYV